MCICSVLLPSLLFISSDISQRCIQSQESKRHHSRNSGIFSPSNSSSTRLLGSIYKNSAARPGTITGRHSKSYIRQRLFQLDTRIFFQKRLVKLMKHLICTIIPLRHFKVILSPQYLSCQSECVCHRKLSGFFFGVLGGLCFVTAFHRSSFIFIRAIFSLTLCN